MRRFIRHAAVICATAASLSAQDQDQVQEPALSQAGYLMNLTSGTSMNPFAWPMPMMMQRKSSWTLMFMGQGFLIEPQQSGPGQIT
jgi:hypothetical protein